jgi:hypothetical protein
MSKDKRVPLRAEDATSWEEFQARYDAEVAVALRRSESPKKWLWTLAGTVCTLIDLILWVGVVQWSSPGRWIALPFALFFIFPIIICIALGPVWGGIPIPNRKRELDAVRDDWKARVERGEIPMTTPGGPKVWQDQ